MSFQEGGCESWMEASCPAGLYRAKGENALWTHGSIDSMRLDLSLF